MMRIPSYLEVAQWALLFGLGGLVIVLYRQLGRLLSHSGKHEEPGPEIGSRAAPIRYLQVPAGTPSRVAPGDGMPLLIAFVDPTCPACEQLVSSLSAPQVADELLGCTDLAADVRPAGLCDRLPGFPGDQPGDRQAGQRRRSRKLPADQHSAARGVDRAGTVRAAGIARMPAEILAMSRTIVTESEAAW